MTAAKTNHYNNMTLDLLSSFGKTGSTNTSDAYPIINDPAVTKKATRMVEALVTCRTLDAVIKGSKVDLRTIALDQFNDYNRKAAEYKTSVVITTERNEKVAHDVIVTFTEGYQVIDADKKAKVVDIVGEDFFNANFSETFGLSINSDAVPEEKRTDLIKGLLALMAGLGVDPALAVKAKGGFSPNGGFNATRIKELPPTINAKLESILPTPASVGEHKKTKTTVAKKAPAKKAPAKKAPAKK